MNRILLVLGAVLVLGSTASFAQNNGISIGIEGGPNRSSFWGNDFIKQQKTLEKPTFFSAGATFEYTFTELLSLKTSLGFERKGVKSEAQVMDATGYKTGVFKWHSRHDYLILPLLAKVSLGKKPTFFANAGPYVGYLLKETVVSEDHELRPGTSTDLTEYNKRLDMGMTIGLGTGIPVSATTSLTLELRHNLGLYNTSKVPVYNNGEVRTSSTNLLLGIAYKLKG